VCGVLFWMKNCYYCSVGLFSLIFSLVFHWNTPKCDFEYPLRGVRGSGGAVVTIFVRYFGLFWGVSLFLVCGWFYDCKVSFWTILALFLVIFGLCWKWCKKLIFGAFVCIVLHLPSFWASMSLKC
jgi:hypothetical protein